MCNEQQQLTMDNQQQSTMCNKQRNKEQQSREDKNIHPLILSMVIIRERKYMNDAVDHSPSLITPKWMARGMVHPRIKEV